MNIFNLNSPNVLECHYFSSGHTYFKPSKRIVANYELDFNLHEGRVMTVNDKSYVIEKNSLVFRRPGEVVISKGTYNMYVLTFSFDKSIKNYDRNLSHQIPYAASDIALLNQLPTYIKPHHSGEIIEIYKQLISTFGTEIYENICSQLVTRLLYLFAAETVNVKILTSLPYNNRVNEIISYISEHYSEPLTLDMISNNVHLDKSYMIRCFKKATGRTPIEYLTEKRLEIAKSLLSTTNLNVSEIATLCGFSNASYFTSSFRSIIGVTPTTYRKER